MPGPAGVFDKRSTKPKMHDVRMNDLVKPDRLLLLFEDAERHGMVTRCEAHKLAFFSAAQHARRVARHNVAGLFARIVRKGLYEFLSQEDVRRVEAV
jgi:hypothetical protein